jgi:hypothetical protein
MAALQLLNHCRSFGDMLDYRIEVLAVIAGFA